MEERAGVVDELDAVHGEHCAYLGKPVGFKEFLAGSGCGKALSQLRAHESQGIAPGAVNRRGIDGERQLQKLSREMNDRHVRRLLLLLGEGTKQPVIRSRTRHVL